VKPLTRRTRPTEYLILAALVGACLLSGVAIGVMIRPAPAAVTSDAPPEASSTEAPTSPPLSPADVAARWGGSVAEVVVEYRAGRRAQSVETNGSGVYVDARGYFLTNHHVIEDVLSARVRLADGRELPVSDSAYDRTHDIAILFTGPVDGLEPVAIGASKALRVGDPVSVVGYPRVGDDVLPGTLTAGVISGLDRLNVTAGNISPEVGMLQIDAAINAGNSGGALFDARGALVGIPTMKIASGYGEDFEGLAFAIPIDTAWPIAVRLIDEMRGGGA